MRASNIEFDEEFGGYVSAEGEGLFGIDATGHSVTGMSHSVSISPAVLPSSSDEGDEDSEFAHYNLMVFSSLAASRRRQDAGLDGH